uniref:Uncharacterized protein n=1 Tax=Podoviridae sp. ct9A73 TaxID=2825225 RepID=A0A8S5UJR5_9CAUD|nr:MAG TPA: hypothetical protein [Podoviridae sp. ct9A73]
MFGGVLNKLFSKGASQYGDDIVARLATNYGDDIARSAGSGVLNNLMRNEADDIAAKAVASAAPEVVEAAVPKVASVADDVVEAAVPKVSVDDVLEAAAAPKNDIVRQLTDGVDKVAPINPNIADNYAVEGATNKALADNNTLASKLNKIGEAVEDSGSNLRNNQIIGAVKDKKVLQRAPDAIKYADKYGFTDGQYEDLANIMTGNEGILSNFNNNALKNAQVSALVPDEARTKALKAIENSIALEPHQKKTLTNIINTANDVPQGKIAERLAERGENRAAAIGEADIYDLHKAVQELEGKAYDMTGKGADAARKIVRDYAGDLKKSINAASKDVYNNPDNIQELSEALVGANLSPRLTQDIVKQLRDGVDYTTLRSMQSPFVTLGQIAKQQKMAPLAGGVGGQSFNNPLAQVAEEVVGKPLAAATGKALQTGGRALQLASKNSDKIANGAKNTALAGAGLLALGQMNGGQQQGADQLSGNSGQLGGAQGAQAQQKELQQAQQLQAMQQLMQPSKFAGKDRDQIEQAYMAAAADNNPKAVQFYASMLEQLDKKDAMNQKQLAALQKASSSKTSKDDQKKADAAKKAASIETMYKQAGGAQGPVGVLNNLLNSATLGMFNPGASAYEANQQALAVALARAAGDSGALSNQDIQGYKSMLPLTTDSPQAAKLKLQNIYAQLGQ